MAPAAYYTVGVITVFFLIIILLCLNPHTRVYVVRFVACCFGYYHTVSQSCSMMWESVTDFCGRKRRICSRRKNELWNRVIITLTHLDSSQQSSDEGPPLETAPEIQVHLPESDNTISQAVVNPEAPPQNHPTMTNHYPPLSPLLQRARPQYNMIVAGGVDTQGNTHTRTTADGDKPKKFDQTVSKHTSLQATLVEINEEGEGTRGGGEEEMETRDDQNKEDKMEVYKQPVMKEDLEEYLTHAIRSDLLTNQFQNVPVRFNKSMAVAVLPCNRKKNRYRNNLPYDDTRVVLQHDMDASPGADYINANYVRQSIGKTKAYIASQGPKDFNERTIDHFWSMIWQEKTNVVVMLARLTETGKVKVAQYWPEVNDEMRYGEVRVQVTSYTERLDYVVRRMLVIAAGECREVVHYQFLQWPDHDVPQTPFSFALMVQDICSWQRSGPILVHCSAGIGRTGTLLLVLTLLDQLEVQRHLRPIDALISLRLARPNLVENQAQYKFAHQVLLEVLFSETTSCPIPHFYQQLNIMRPYLHEQYQKLKSLPKNLTTRWGDIPMHAPFNRNPNILPVDGRQVFLQMVGGMGASQYVNAVRVHGMRQRDALIVTEHPLMGTLDRAWRMIYEKRALAWVIIHQHEDLEAYPPVLPASGQGDLDHVTVSVDDISYHSEFTDSIVTVTPLRSLMSPPHTLRVLHLMGWDADKELPDSPLPLLELLQHLQYLRHQVPATPTNSGLSTAQPVIITCSDGTKGCGVMVALLVAQCRLELQGVVDVYRAVQAILFDRPQFITSLAQYEFLYDAMGVYIQCRFPQLHLSLPHDDPTEEHDSDATDV